MICVVETDRLTLRTWDLRDAAAAFRVWGDSQVMRWVGQPHSDEGRSRNAIEAAIEAHEHHGCCLWRMERRVDRATLGVCGFHVYEGPGSTAPGQRWLELAYHLRPDAWGQGYATEAGIGCVSYARASLDATHLVALTHPDNHASIRVLTKLGFVADSEESGEIRHVLPLDRETPCEGVPAAG